MMDNNQTAVQLTSDQAFQFAANMMVNQQRVPSDTVETLVSMGVNAADAEEVVSNIQNQITDAKQERAKKDILYGALWCGGGTIATMANIGFIFWGAILFGGVQLVKGLIAYSSSD